MRDLCKCRGVCKLAPRPGQNPAVSQEEREVRRSYCTQCVLGKDWPCTLSPGIGPGGSPVRCWAPGGLVSPVGWIVQVRRASTWVRGGSQVAWVVRSSVVIRGPPGGAGVRRGIDAELAGAKCELPGLWERGWGLSSCLNLHHGNHCSSLVTVTALYTFPVLALFWPD